MRICSVKWKANSDFYIFFGRYIYCCHLRQCKYWFFRVFFCLYCGMNRPRYVKMNLTAETEPWIQNSLLLDWLAIYLTCVWIFYWTIELNYFPIYIIFPIIINLQWRLFLEYIFTKLTRIRKKISPLTIFFINKINTENFLTRKQFFFTNTL